MILTRTLLKFYFTFNPEICYCALDLNANQESTLVTIFSPHTFQMLKIVHHIGHTLLLPAL